jgi:hypothetical protein
MTTYDVSTLAELNSAIEAVDAAAAGSGAQTIDIASGTISVTSALEAINLNTGVSLTIDGASGAVLDGGGTQRGFFVCRVGRGLVSAGSANSPAGMRHGEWQKGASN